MRGIKLPAGRPLLRYTGPELDALINIQQIPSDKAPEERGARARGLQHPRSPPDALYQPT